MTNGRILCCVGMSVLAVAIGSTSFAQQLLFAANEVNPVAFYLQMDHYCGVYRDGATRSGANQYIGDESGRAMMEIPLVLIHRPASSAKDSRIIGMWADQLAQCDMMTQPAFYDSVWRDSIRFEALVNYKDVFSQSLKGRVSMAPYAVDDGVVTTAMTQMLTTDTTDTLGAQNDDIMWWALAFLRAYESEPAHTEYLTAARQVFKRIQQSPQQAVCGGGITWGGGTNYKNAITNALYVVLAARLAALSEPRSAERKEYIAAAVAEADWLLDRSSLFSDGGVLLDGIHFKEEKCSDIPDGDVWTYSQGVAIDGLAELTALTHNPRYADRAQALLLRVLDPKQLPALVNAEGILQEPALRDRDPIGDVETFKGLLVRHVGYALPYFRQEDAKRYAVSLQRGTAFITLNANTLWKNRRTREKRIEFPFDWANSSGSPMDMRSTASGLNLLNAAWSVQFQDRRR